MTSKKKKILSRLMALDSPKTDKYLADFAGDLLVDIKKAEDNDSVLENLDLLTEFVYKVPKEAIEIVRYIFGKEPNPATIHEMPFGKLEGKSHNDLILKCIELLEHIRYIAPDDVLRLVAQLSLQEDPGIRGKALEIAKKFSQYDYNVLTKSKIGYGAQRKALDFVTAWSREEQLKHTDFVKTILKEVLSSSVEGTTSGLNDNSDLTLTMHFGAVSPTDFLKKMRREAIDLTYELYKATNDIKLKLDILGIFDEASRTPLHVAYGDDLAQMITDDLKYLIDIYRKIIFGEEEERMTNHLGIVAAIEQRLYWINRSEKKKIEESEKLRIDILHNDLYALFRLLVGDPITYQEEEGWDTAEKTRHEKIDKFINSIEETGLDEWFDKLNKIASQHALVEDWKFGTFRNFLQKLSETKPKIAGELLQMGFENNSPLKYFAGGFLDGFRAGSHFEQWDNYVNQITKSKDIQLVNAVIFSLNIPQEKELEKFIRDEDINILEKITKKKDEFSFLEETDDRVFHYAIFNTLIRNFRRSPGRIEPLIIKEMEENPKYMNIFFTGFPMAIHRNWITIKELQPASVKFLTEQIIELQDLDWHIQELVLAIGERDGLKAVLDIFMKRIQKDAKRKGEERWNLDVRYDPIPYHFNPTLIKFIVEDSEYVKIASDWAAEMTTDWSTYNWHVGNFLQRTGKGFSEILDSLIQKGDDDSLMKAARAMHSIEGANFYSCIEIIKRTDNPKIISQIEANMYATGVVSGEYGIAEAYENKARALENYKAGENERVKKFVDRMIKSFSESAKRERQRADEEKQLRKIEFEG